MYVHVHWVRVSAPGRAYARHHDANLRVFAGCHSIPGQPAGVGIRDFSKDWVTPATASAFNIPEACAAGVPAFRSVEQHAYWGDSYYY